MSTMETGAVDLSRHHQPRNLSDRFALGFVKLLRFLADTFFAKRYGHRAVVLETVAAVPGMVGGALQHLKSLRRMTDDNGWIRMLLDEAENERMHLMTFVQIAKPSSLERALILFAQGAFFNGFVAVYLILPLNYLEKPEPEKFKALADDLSKLTDDVIARVESSPARS